MAYRLHTTKKVPINVNCQVRKKSTLLIDFLSIITCAKKSPLPINKPKNTLFENINVLTQNHLK